MLMISLQFKGNYISFNAMGNGIWDGMNVFGIKNIVIKERRRKKCFSLD